LVGESEGRSSIDAILAAGQLPDAAPGTKLATTGYSQGGHGAIWTAQVADEWAPDLEVVGTMAGAPASETQVILAASAFVPALAGFTYMILAGFGAAYPEADPSLFLTPKGVELLDAVDTGCARDTFAAVAGIPSEELLLSDAGSMELWSTLGAENNAGTAKTHDGPTLIIHSEQDNTVPLEFSKRLLSRMCENGQVVERRLLPDGGNHGQAVIPAYQQGVEWLEGRFQASPPDPVDDCPT
jgi:pimeloyl-ACP methyl ester carboxylesterase